MAQRRRVLDLQRLVAASAVRKELGDLLGRQQLAVMAGVPRLRPAATTATRGLAGLGAEGGVPPEPGKCRRSSASSSAMRARAAASCWRSSSFSRRSSSISKSRVSGGVHSLLLTY